MTDETNDREAVLKAFAEAIHAKAALLQRKTLPPAYRARVREAISDDLKKVSNLVVPEASKKALREARTLGVDLYAMTWHDQPSFDGGRDVFHLEHVRPVSVLRGECLASASANEIIEILRTRLRVAWILKAEDNELTRLGYRSVRPDPDKAYREAKIALISRDAARENLTLEDEPT